jgi:hypothetical protein
VHERAVPRGHVRRRVERRRARKQVRETRGEEQRLLPTHAPAERIDAMPIDVEPGQGVFDDLRHARKVADLAGVAPGEKRQRAPLSLRVHDGEPAGRRQTAPAPNVQLRAHAATVR